MGTGRGCLRDTSYNRCLDWPVIGALLAIALEASISLLVALMGAMYQILAGQVFTTLVLSRLHPMS